MAQDSLKRQPLLCILLQQLQNKTANVKILLSISTFAVAMQAHAADGQKSQELRTSGVAWVKKISSRNYLGHKVLGALAEVEGRGELEVDSEDALVCCRMPLCFKGRGANEELVAQHPQAPHVHPLVMHSAPIAIAYNQLGPFCLSWQRVAGTAQQELKVGQTRKALFE